LPRSDELAIVLLYPELLGTYGDRGNAQALSHRARVRGVDARVIEVSFGEPMPRSADIYLLGGSEDGEQALAMRALLAEADAADVLAAAPACFAVCAGFQLLSREFVGPSGRRQPGLGLLDVECDRLSGPRAVGEVVADVTAFPGIPTLTGYENHGGSASLGPGARPLGTLLNGTGNGDGLTEGAVQDNVVATYLHGPVLVRNPRLADLLLERVMGDLSPVQDEVVPRLRQERIAAGRRRPPTRSQGRSHSTWLAGLFRAS
jgi:CobQ-like glutamine amidotransferase family enzyme